MKIFREDNVVYHGLAGHFFVQGIDHAVKIRITADMQDRVNVEMAREGLSAKEALHLLKEDDEQRRRWSLWLYGIDTAASHLYDLVLHLKRLSPDDAAAIICHAARLDRFHTTAASQQALSDLALGAEVRATLIELVPDLDVRAEKGDIQLRAKADPFHFEKMAATLKRRTEEIRGVKKVDIMMEPISAFHD